MGYMSFQCTRTLGTASTLGLTNINVGTNAWNHIHAPAALLPVKEPQVPTGRTLAVWRGVEDRSPSMPGI